MNWYSTTVDNNYTMWLREDALARIFAESYDSEKFELQTRTAIGQDWTEKVVYTKLDDAQNAA